MNLDQMTDAAKALAVRRGYKQTEVRPRKRGVTIGSEDLSDAMVRFRYDAQYGRIEGYVDIEGAQLIDLRRAIGEALLLWDGAEVRVAEVTGVTVECSDTFGMVQTRVEFSGWL